MLTYSVGGSFNFHFCEEHHLFDLVTGYMMILMDSRIKKTAVSSS